VTEQELFWQGDFGDEYTSRNYSEKIVVSNINLFSEIMVKAHDVKTIFEVGCNAGLNLIALTYLDPNYRMSGIDINGGALSKLKQLFDQKEKDAPELVQGSIADFETEQTYDMVFTKGVLIHIAPELLPAIYNKMVAMSNRYIMVAEYYNPTPVELPYRGNQGKLFKRDFAGELMDRHNLRLVSYGFAYHRDLYPQDDLCWFLLEKEIV